jgi:hypothetical protein
MDPAHPSQPGSARAEDPRDQALSEFKSAVDAKGRILKGARVYLSGPMDFVASREEEKKNGWRTRLGEFLRTFGVVVYDPWDKPKVLGLPEYGKEDEFTAQARERWSFESSVHGDRTRTELCNFFWSALHVDLRMVDTTDFTIAYCPTNVYSVGTPHEIATARLQRKPVLLVSPPVEFPALDELTNHLRDQGDAKGQQLLRQLTDQIPVRANPRGIPSLWYMALLDGSYFFDGFGFAAYRDRFPQWQPGALDQREEQHPPQRPLLSYLERLDRELPTRYDARRGDYMANDDWLILEAEDFR